MAADKLVELIFRARGAKQTSAEVKGLGRDLSNAGAKAQVAGRDAAKGMDRAEKATSKSRKGLKLYNREIDAQRDSIGDLKFRINELTEARDKFADPRVIQRYNRKIDELSTKMRGLETAQPGKQNKSIGSSIGGFAGKLAVGAGAAIAFQRGISRAIEKGSEFESKLADLEAITGITGNRLDRLGDDSIELSKKYGTAASDIIEANKLVASKLAEKIDFNTEEGFQELKKISEDAIVLQKAAGIDLPEAVNATTSAINQFNLKASDSREVIDTLAAGAKYGAAEVPEITRAMVNAGAAAAGAGQSIQTTNAAIQVLAANGQVGERAGTALRGIFTRLQTKGEELAKYGIENVDLKTNGLIATLKQLRPIMEDTTALNAIFGEEAQTQAQILIRNADSVESLTEKVSESGVANKQATVRMETFEGATDKLSTAIDGVLIPAFTETAGLTVKLVTATTSLISQFSGGLRAINSWFDAHYKLRRELTLQEGTARAQIGAMSDLREELALYASQANLTAEEQRQLDEAFQGTTETVRNNASNRFDDLFGDKKERDQLIAQIKEIENSEGLSAGWGARAKNARLKELRTDLQALNMTISNNEKILETQLEFLEKGEKGLEGYMAEVQKKSIISKLTAEMVGLSVSSDKQKEILAELKTELENGADGMEALAAATKKAQEASGQNGEGSSLSDQISQAKAEYQALIDQPDLDEAGLFKGVELANRIQELEEAKQKQEELIEILQNYDGTRPSAPIEEPEFDIIPPDPIEFTPFKLDPKIGQESIDFFKNELVEAEQAYTNASSDEARKRHQERIDWLEIEIQAKEQGLSTEEVLKQEQQERDTERHEQRVAQTAEYVQAVSGAIGNITGLLTAQNERRIQQLEQEKEQKLENINAELAQENLSEQQKKRLLKQREQIEEKYNKKIAAQKRKQFEKEKVGNIAQAIMQTAIAIVEALPNIPLSIIVGAAGAAQIATIASQKNPYEKGGWIGGRRHRDGGTPVEAEVDEFITNRQSAMAAPRALEYMNSSPAAARRVEMMVDRYVGSSPSKAEKGGWVNPARNISVQSSPQIDSSALSIAVREGMKGIVVRPVITASEISAALDEYFLTKKSVGNF